MIGFQKYFLSQEVKISNVPADIYKKPVYNQMPNAMAALPNIRGAFCKSSLIPVLVPRRKV